MSPCQIYILVFFSSRQRSRRKQPGCAELPAARAKPAPAARSPARSPALPTTSAAAAGHWGAILIY